MPVPVSAAFPVFYDTSGEPIENGFVYVGVANLDPATNQKTVYWDIDGTVPASQPLRIIGGRITRTGTPALIYTDDGYSLKVQDGNQSTVYVVDRVTQGFVPDGSALLVAQNLADLEDVATARTNLGLGSAALSASGDFATAAQGALADTAYQEADLATKAQAEAGTDNETLMTPLRTAEAIAAQQAVRAWVNFDGDGVADIRASYNIDSLTYNGTGDYTITFDESMPNANYAPIITAQDTTSGRGLTRLVSASTTEYRFITTLADGTPIDVPNIYVAVFG